MKLTYLLVMLAFLFCACEGIEKQDEEPCVDVSIEVICHEKNFTVSGAYIETRCFFTDCQYSIKKCSGAVVAGFDENCHWRRVME